MTDSDSEWENVDADECLVTRFISSHTWDEVEIVHVAGPPPTIMLKGEKAWVTVQVKTFTKWLNSKLASRNIEVKDLLKDLSDGVTLVHILEILSEQSLGRYAAAPKLRVQKFENVNVCLDFIRSQGIQIHNIGAEDIVDGNQKIILGLIWTLISRFTISDIGEGTVKAKEGLLLWLQRKTAHYEGVTVRDFGHSWNDGQAFCALIDNHRPDLLNFYELDPTEHRKNMKLAFEVASQDLGIPALIDVDDVCDVMKPDEYSMITYLAGFYHAFSTLENIENAGRRLDKFATNMDASIEMKSNYEKRTRILINRIANKIISLRNFDVGKNYAEVKDQSRAFNNYKATLKREWVTEKSELSTLLSNIQTKMSTYRLNVYRPPRKLALEAVDSVWQELLRTEKVAYQRINQKMADVKQDLRKQFAREADSLANCIDAFKWTMLDHRNADIDIQIRELTSFTNEQLPAAGETLEQVRKISLDCDEANIEENDLTSYTIEELAYDYDLAVKSVRTRLAFLENQKIARGVTNLTPIQLEEFESVFRHFADKHHNCLLGEVDFSAALASLGLTYDAGQMSELFKELQSKDKAVTGVYFEPFIRYMVTVTEDNNTADQVLQSFNDVAEGKAYVTELDLRHSLMTDEAIETFVGKMPPWKGDVLEKDREAGEKGYDYAKFMLEMCLDEGLAQRDSTRRVSGKLTPPWEKDDWDEYTRKRDGIPP